MNYIDWISISLSNPEVVYAQTFSLNVNFLFNMKLIVVATAIDTINDILYGTKFSTM